MSTHPLRDLTGPLAGAFCVVMVFGAVVVMMGVIEHLKYEEREWSIEWEPVLVALLEVTFGLVLLWKIDQWIKLFTEGGAR